MAQRRHELDTHILTVFFMAAVPVVAFGAWLVVGMAQGRLEELPRGEPRAAGPPDQAGHRALRGRADRRPAPARPRPRGRQGGSWAKEAPARRPPALRPPPRDRPGPAQPPLDPGGGLQASGWWRPPPATRGSFPSVAHGRRSCSSDEPSLRPFVGDIQRVPGPTAAVARGGLSGAGSFGRALRGLVRGLVDASDLYGVLSSVRIGRTGHAVLLRADDGLDPRLRR